MKVVESTVPEPTIPSDVATVKVVNSTVPATTLNSEKVETQKAEIDTSSPRQTKLALGATRPREWERNCRRRAHHTHYLPMKSASTSPTL